MHVFGAEQWEMQFLLPHNGIPGKTATAVDSATCAKDEKRDLLESYGRDTCGSLFDLARPRLDNSTHDAAANRLLSAVCVGPVGAASVRERSQHTASDGDQPSAHDFFGHAGGSTATSRLRHTARSVGVRSVTAATQGHVQVSLRRPPAAKLRGRCPAAPGSRRQRRRRRVEPARR